MAWDSGVKVEIISNNQSLPLYPDPDAGNAGDRGGTIQYVEAVTGATFEIHITLEKDFRWGPCDLVQVLAKYDGDQTGWNKDVRRNDYSPRPRAVFNNLTTWCPASQQWKTGSLSFGALQTSTSSILHSRRLLTSSGRRASGR